MTLKEKINHSAKLTQFILFKEGLFYKCYNEDAMVFVKNVKEYKVSEKFVKSLGADVYSIGFAVSEVEKGNLTLEEISEKIGASRFEVSGTDLVFILDETEVKSNYKTWSETLKKEIALKMVKATEPSYMAKDKLDRMITLKVILSQQDMRDHGNP